MDYGGGATKRQTRAACGCLAVWIQARAARPPLSVTRQRLSNCIVSICGTISVRLYLFSTIITLIEIHFIAPLLIKIMVVDIRM